MQIYTLGYQGLTQDLYLQTLINAGVNLVIDVRENPWSQRSDYIGAVLKRRLAPAGIDYEHWRGLGNPAANRKTATTAAQCLRRYRNHLDREGTIVRMLAEKITREWNRNRKVCLTCYEHSHSDCHRSVIIDVITLATPGVIPIHLEPEITRHRTRQRPHHVVSRDDIMA